MPPSTGSARDPLARSITFRLPLEMHTAIAAMSRDENRSMNACTCMLISEALAVRQKAAAKAAAELKELRRIAREAKKAAKAATPA